MFTNYGTLSITGSTISGNTSKQEGGGGISHTAGILTVSNSTIANNTVTYTQGSGTRYGGGLFVTNSPGLAGSTVDLSYSTIAGNSVSNANTNTAGGIGVDAGS